MQKLLLVLVAVIGAALAQGDNVEKIKQNYEDKLNSKIVEQINMELQASYLYQAYGHYFGRADVALPGFAKWFEKASLEERSHATGLIEYINKRGGVVTLNNLNFNEMCNTINDELSGDMFTEFGRTKACICSFMSQKKEKSISGECLDRNQWKNGLWAFQDALVLERKVNDRLLKLHNEADIQHDVHFAHILEHGYLEEQVDAIKQLGDYIRQLERAGEGLGEYLFDKSLE